MPQGCFVTPLSTLLIAYIARYAALIAVAAIWGDLSRSRSGGGGRPERAGQGFADQGGTWSHVNTGCFERRDLICSGPFASGNDGASVSHPAARRSGAPGDETRHRLFYVCGNEGGGFFFRRAADFSDQNDSMRFRISGHQAENVDEIGSDNRVSADAHARGLADAEGGELADGLIGERAAAGNHAHVALSVNAARHDAHFAFSRRDHARTVGADEPGLPSRQKLLDADHIQRRDAFGDGDHERHSRIGCLHDGVGSERRRNKDHRDVRSCLPPCFLHGVEDGDAVHRRAALSRRYPGHHLGAIFHGLPGVERSFAPRDALHQQPRIFINKNGHRICSLIQSMAPCQANYLFGRVFHAVGDGKVQSGLAQNFLAELHVGTFEPHDHGHLDTQSSRRRYHSARHDIAAHDAAKDVDEHGSHVRVAQNDLKSVAHLFFACAAPCVQKIRGAASGVLNDVHGGHRQARAVYHASYVSVETDVIHFVVYGLYFEGVFFIQVAQLLDFRMAVHGVVIKSHLGVEGHELSVSRDDERVDFSQ